MINIYLGAMNQGFDSMVAKQFYKGFRQIKNCSVFWIEKDILPGQNRKVKAASEINKADFFLSLISEFSIKSAGFHFFEQRKALDRLDEMPSRNIFAIPIWIGNPENINLHNESPLKELFPIALFPDWQKALAKIFNIMGLHIPETMTIPQIQK